MTDATVCQQVLQEQEGLAVQKCEGRAGPYPAGNWGLWFRYTFKLSQPCRLGLDMGLPGEALLKAASLVLLDNDTSQVHADPALSMCYKSRTAPL